MDSPLARFSVPDSLSDLLRVRAAERPDADFLRYADRVYLYADVEADVTALAAAWQDLGLEAGDRVVLNLPNGPEAVVSVLAAARLGAPVVPLNPLSSPQELRFVLRNTEATVAVTAERIGETDFLQAFEELLPELPALQYVATVGDEDLWYDDRIFQFEDLVSAGRGLDLAPVELDASDDAAILYTAGTSHKQKGAILSHGNMLFAGAATAAVLDLTPEDRTLCAVPLFNIFGLGAALVPALVSGGSLLLLDTFDEAEVLDTVARYRATVLHGVPTMFVLLQRELAASPRDVSSLRTGIVAGAPASPDLVRSIRRTLVPQLEIAYGLTETSATVSITDREMDEDARSGSVGRPLPGVDVCILDGDECRRRGDEVGDIAVRGPNVMRGYFRQPSATRAAFTEDGFLRTGDLGKLDAAGNLHIVGRESDTINRGGYGVHPREIEEHLRSHPAVDDAVVVGLPNDVLGELICACVVPIEGALISEHEIRDHCRSALAEYKLPDIVRFLEDVPRSEEGSPLRAELARTLRLQDAAPAKAVGDEAP